MKKLYSCKTSSALHRRCGYSYVEVVLSAVIISVLLVSALRLSTNLGRSQQAGTIKQLCGRLVIDMLEEIKQQDYKDPAGAPDTLARETGELTDDRTNYNDVDDYHGWSASPPEDRLDNPLPHFSGVTRSVTIRFVSSADFAATSASDEGYKEVTVTVTKNSDGVLLDERKFILADYEP